MIRYAIPLLAMSALAAPAAAAEVQIQAQAPVVELSVSETVNSAPDIAQVGTGVTTRARTAKDAVRLNAAAMQKVVDRLKALGIAAKDIQTSNFNLNAQFNYPNGGGTPVFAGYEASNQVSAKVRQVDKVGDVLDALVAAGANNISGPTFMLDDDGAPQQAARNKAFQRGSSMAQDYARMAGYTGVRLLEVSENVQSRGPLPPMPYAVRAEAADAKTPIEAGEVGTTVSLTLKYEMTR
uniref:SIMPL domain-containing protein n=1 Tax=Altererythrobacter segetis TaxID=1104773 RepID=UPI00140D1241|nr:SIMPL domain-containing protein [Altererythrobacter segetis]